MVSLKESDRHSLLHFLEDEKYEEVMAVLGSFPYVTMDIKSQGEWSFPLHIDDLLSFIWLNSSFVPSSHYIVLSSLHLLLGQAPSNVEKSPSALLVLI